MLSWSGFIYPTGWRIRIPQFMAPQSLHVQLSYLWPYHIVAIGRVQMPFVNRDSVTTPSVPIYDVIRHISMHRAGAVVCRIVSSHPMQPRDEPKRRVVPKQVTDGYFHFHTMRSGSPKKSATLGTFEVSQRKRCHLPFLVFTWPAHSIKTSIPPFR